MVDNYVKAGLVLKVPGKSELYTLENDIVVNIVNSSGFPLSPKEGEAVLFYENGETFAVKPDNVYYSVNQPDVPDTSGMWFNPNDKLWYRFMYADWGISYAMPIANINVIGTEDIFGDITYTTNVVDYVGYRVLNDEVFATKSDLPDLTPYATTEALTQGLVGKQDTLIAGENITIEDNVISASGGSSYAPPLLSYQWTDHILNDIRWLRADTFSWQDGGVYFGTYDTLEAEYNNENSVEETDGTITYKRTPNKYKIADISQEEAILNKYNTDGITWYYIIDTVNKRFKLPRTKYGFTGIRNGVGNDIEQIVILPNITGEINCTSTSTDAQFLADENGNVSSEGALYITSTRSAKTIGQTSNNATAPKGIGLDASRSSNVYSGDGTDTKIQEPATQMYLYFYVGSYTTDAIENTAGLNTELFNGKLDIDCNNTSATGKDFMSSMGMPSSRYIELTMGASGTQYTAPANGWFSCTGEINSSNGFISLKNENIFLRIRNYVVNSGTDVSTFIPAKKGDVISIEWSNFVMNQSYMKFVFIYAEGAE